MRKRRESSDSDFAVVGGDGIDEGEFNEFSAKGEAS
jgi:hypothetical protein